MLVKSNKVITIQNGMVGTESKNVIVKFGAIQSADLLQTGKISFSVADAKSQLNTQQGPRPNVLGNTFLELNNEELNLSNNLVIFKTALIQKLVNYFKPLNPELSESDFEEII